MRSIPMVRNEPVQRRRWASLVLAMAGAASLLPGALAATAQDSGRTLRFTLQDDRLEIDADGAPLAAYVFRDERISRPYFAHLHAPGGVQVSRRHPPLPGIDSTDHELFHPGLWLAFGDLSGHDSWRLKAPIVLREFLQAPTVHKAGEGDFTALLEHRTKDCKPLAVEEFRCSVRLRPEGNWLLLDSLLRPKDAAMEFGDQEEMGLGLRVATSLSVKGGGQLTDSQGRKGESQVWGRTADWCDYAGAVDGERAGVLLVPDPANFRPCWLHARDYGLLVANPFGQRAFTGGEASRIVVPPGESLRLRFAVLLYSESEDKPLDRIAAWRQACQWFTAAKP